MAYGYDDAGDRTSESATTTVTPAGGSPSTTTKTSYYLIDDNNPSGYSQVVEERATPTNAPTLSYVLGEEVLSQSDGTSVLYLLPDGHGSTRLVTDAAGSILATGGRLDYDAWGNAVGFDAGTAVTSILYTGQRYDGAAGLYDLRARMYDPATGEFTSADSRTALDQSQPITLHKYLYCDADPVTLADLSGHDGVSDLAALLGDNNTIGLAATGPSTTQSTQPTFTEPKFPNDGSRQERERWARDMAAYIDAWKARTGNADFDGTTLAAQFAWENNWGRNQFAQQTDNWGNIKGVGPAGFQTRTVWEVLKGRRVNVQAKFRKYHDLDEFLSDYTDLI